MRNLGKKGFTLIEMLIVVVIIGILAAALIPRLTSVKDKANDSARKANLQQLVTAMAMYVLDDGILVTSAGSTGDTYTPAIATALSKGGMKSIPADPSNQQQTIFGKSTTGFVYFSTYGGTIPNKNFIFVSRAETAAAANWVENPTTPINNSTNTDALVLCDKVTEQTSVSGTCAGPASAFRIIMKY